MASPIACRVSRACSSWSTVRAVASATAAWEASSQPAASMSLPNAPGRRE